MFCSFSLCFPLFLPLLIFSDSSGQTMAIHSEKQPQQTHQQRNKSYQPTDMVSSEAKTLFILMESLSSDHSWKTSFPNPCKPGSSWPGIECKLRKDNFLHVSRLDFGSHPYPSCRKTALFPNQIWYLPYLKSVFFFNCFTHTNTSLFVSENRALLNSSLQQLSVRSNPALSGPIPRQIYSLKYLQILTLSQNHLTGSIPVEIFSLSSLVHLDLSYNQLTGSIPAQVGNLKNLVGLDLSYNSLVGSIPETIGQLGLLQKLDLSSNFLLGEVPNTIVNLSSLVFMALSNNRLRGNFPKGLVKLQSLQYFIIDDNPMFIHLPVELGMLVKLQELRLANSGYSGSIPQSFSGLKNLTTLSLQNNRLTGEIPSTFCGLSHIYHLNLSRNLLGGVVPFNSSFLKRLGRNLDLSGNPGLCLNPSEGYSVEIGVKLCGENGSFVKPLKKSRATSFSPSFSLLVAVFTVISVPFILD